MFGSVIKGRQKQEVLEEITTAPTFNLPAFKCLIHAVFKAMLRYHVWVPVPAFFHILPPLCPYKENIHSPFRKKQ